MGTPTFWSKVDIPSLVDCWGWTGRINGDGYGVTHAGEGAHRIAFKEHVGPIPRGLEIDHLCRNRSCVNPTHLEAVTHAENVRRSLPATKRFCANGHEYTPENTYIRPDRPRGGRRDCRKCIAARVATYKRRNAAA